MTKEELFNKTYIGEADTDQEKQEIERRKINPADFFVTHSRLNEVLEDRKGLIFGMKGAGKTNLLQFLIEYATSSNKDVSNVILTEIDLEQLVERHSVFREAAEDKDKASMIAVWWELLAWAALRAIHDTHNWVIRDSLSQWISRNGSALIGRPNERFKRNRIVKRTLKAYNILEPHIWFGPIKNFFNRIKKVELDTSPLVGPVAGPLPVPSLEFHPVGANAAPYHPAKVLQALASVLESKGKELWILMDNVEAAVDYRLTAGRKLALETLIFDIYLDNLSKATYRNVPVKLFSRWDMILRLEDDNKQKLYGKQVLLEWTHQEVVRLILKRLLANEDLRVIIQNETGRDYQKAIDELRGDDLRALFNRVFFDRTFVSPDTDIYDYVGTFFLDGHNTIQPRNIIVWCKETMDQERLTHPGEEAKLPLFSDDAIKAGFGRVSAYATRKDYGWSYPEFETHRRTLIKFLTDQNPDTWVFKNKELRHLFRATPDPKGGEAVNAFWAIGLFRQDEGRLPEDSEHSTIPLLYRQGLRPS